MTAHCHKLFGQQWRLKVAAFALMVLHIPLQSICMAQDTLRVLEEVEVSSQRPPATLHTPVPTQVMDAATLEQNGALQLSDAVRAMAGVVVKDYGGVGGMKTVSARGLGSQFSTLTIDGVPVDNAQNGQADLGRYLLGNAAYVSLSQGQQHDGLLSARGYAAGNVLNMVTAEPEFFLLRRTNLRFSFEGGSFGLRSPSVLWEQKWTSRLRSSLWINHLRSDGDYPFTLYYTASRTDSSSRERRLHSAMQMTTLDANLFYTIASDNRLMFKAHYSGGTHQLPGHVRYYRQEPSAQQTAEQQLFLQGRWTLERELWQMQWMAKYQHSYDQYEDSNFLSSSTHYLMNYYRQQGGYLSGSTLWHVRPWADVGVAADADLAHLHSNLAQRSNVLRRSLIGVAIMQLHYGSWEAKANLVLTDVADRVGDLDTTPQYRRLAPYVAILYSPSLGLNLRLFYKNSYRPPTFSELYFFQSLPRSLRPEKAHQLNAGITVATNQLSITADAYFNRVEDKIVARPGQNMFYWTMENLGQVHIWGLDLTAEYQWRSLIVRGNYSFAHATDRSDPTSSYYGHQIRYTPRHSGGLSARWESPWINLGTQAMIVGHRYTLPQNTPASRLPAYCDLTLTIDRSFDLRFGTLRLKAQILNLLDIQYEVVQFYPMMGRNYKLSIIYEF